MTARGWALKGFRPEASTVVSELRGRRSESVRKGRTIDAEIRLCALYVSQPEMSLRALAAANHMRLANVKEVLRGWGVDLKTRDLIPRSALKEETDICIRTNADTDGAS
jgi:hypothetical protein